MLRRWVARGLTAVTAGLIAAISLGAAPAYADDADVSASSTFTAGGSPGQVNIRLRREDNGCVQARAQLQFQLDGLRADEVAVAVNNGGQLTQLDLNGGNGAFSTQLVRPVEETMCERRNRSQTVQFRIAFSAGAPDGEVRFVGLMLNQNGERLADGDDSSRVRGGEPTASPTPKKSKSPSPRPSPTPSETTEEATEEPTEEESTVAAAAPQPSTVSLNDGGGLFGGLGPAIAVGAAMVGIGIALIVFLFRRGRAERGGEEGFVAAPAGPAPWPAPGGRHSAAASPTQIIPVQPPPGQGYATERYPGQPSGPNAHRGGNYPPDPTTRLPRITE